jgi:hypothetical protein
VGLRSLRRDNAVLAAGPNALSFDITTTATPGTSTLKGHTARMHVERVRTGAGWQTTYTFAPDPLFMGARGSQHFLARIEIDPFGHATAMRTDGSTIDLAHVQSALRSPAAILSSFPADARSQTVQKVLAAGIPRLASMQVQTQWIDGLFRDRATRAAEVAKVGAAFTAGAVDALGRQHFLRSLQRQTLDLAIDTSRAVVTGLSVAGPSSPLAQIDYDYVSGPSDLSIRTRYQIHYLAGSKTPGRSIIVSLSRITVDGQEVLP